jgi:hypothetical protein
MKGLIENFPLVPAIDKDGMQGPVKILSPPDIGGFNGTQRFDHPTGANRQSGAA